MSSSASDTLSPKASTQSNIKIDEILRMIPDESIEFIDLRFTDTHGKEQHVTIPSDLINASIFTEGKMFDGSSIAGWKSIHDSDMMLLPDPSTAVIDPFYQDKTLNLRCSVVDPITHEGYDRDPRSIARRAEEHLVETGIGDKSYFGPELEFFIFDDVRYSVDINGASYRVDSVEGSWNSNTKMEQGNLGHRPSVKGGYFPVPPVDSSQDLRSEMCRTLKKMGHSVEAHHHEVATGNQNEIATRYNTLCNKADETQRYKYVVHNVADLYGRSATFMPKPLVGDNGSGMHCHQSIHKDGINIFDGDAYEGLSQEALWYIGGIIKHAKSLNAFTNPSTNSYKRLVPGYEAPTLLAYSARNRSASIRVPFVGGALARRIEVRFPDPTANPYLAFAAMLMAGLDGIQNKIDPGEPMDQDLYALDASELKHIPQVARSLEEALDSLEADMDYLLTGSVFTEDAIRAYIELKREHVDMLRSTTHPIEFMLYYSV